MITNELYSKVLLDPVRRGCDELFIVSGYASATFARRHINDLLKLKKEFQISLIIGMPKTKVDHQAYLQLHTEFGNAFRGYYLNSAPPVHSKVFSWFGSGAPQEGYSGSANYSQYGFFEDKQINQMTADNASEIKHFFDGLKQMSMYMPEVEIEDLPVYRIPQVHGSVPAGSIEWIVPWKTVRISFLDKKGQLPAVSGLNWGQ